MSEIIAQSYDVIIVGAGVIGCSIALSLSRAGFNTLNIDANPVAGYGSTSHSSAIIRPFYSHRTSCAVAHEARHRWLHWPEFLNAQDPSGYAHYQETGGTILVSSLHPDQFEQNIQALKSLGISYEWLDTDALLKRHPGLSLTGYGPPSRSDQADFGEPSDSAIIGGIYLPACGHVNDPQLAAHNLCFAAQAEGAQFQFGQRVSGFIQNHQGLHGVVVGDGSQIHARAVVNAAGPHSSQVNDMIDWQTAPGISTQAHRHEVAYVKAPSQTEGVQGFLVDLDTGVYMRGDGADLLIGSADPACDTADVVEADSHFDAFTEQWTTQVHRAGMRIPSLSIESKARGTVGLYDVSPDWIPIYDKTNIPGYFVAIGTSGNQFKNAPLVGDMMRTIIEQEFQGLDHDRQPAQFYLPEVAQQVDLSFYSRQRDLQPTSSVLA